MRLFLGPLDSAGVDLIRIKATTKISAFFNLRFPEVEVFRTLEVGKPSRSPHRNVSRCSQSLKDETEGTYRLRPLVSENLQGNVPLGIGEGT